MRYWIMEVAIVIAFLAIVAAGISQGQDGPQTPVVPAPDKPVVMIFTMPGCEHCRKSVPEWEKHARDLGIAVEKIDYSTAIGAQLFTSYRVTATPTALFGARKNNGHTELAGRVNGGSGVKFHDEGVELLKKIATKPAK